MYLEKEKNIKIYYETYGSPENTPMVLIHGIGADHNMFKLQIEKYKKRGLYLIVPDLRGHGKSSKVKSLELSDWVKDIEDLMNHLNLKKAILLGISMGGVIVQKFIMRHPEKVSKVILSDTFGELKTLNEKFAGYAQVYGFKLFKYLPKNFSANLVASAYKDYPEEVYNYFKEATLNADFEQLFLARKAINKINILNDLNKLATPALVMVGNQASIMVKPSEKIANNLLNSELKIIEGAMDPANLTKPAIFDEYVLDFIKK
jgi:3-oxoadipate enol-lactonase